MPRLKFHRRWLLLAVLATGCGPSVSQEELGKVEFKVPRVEGADEPYRIPQLDGLPIQKKSDDPLVPLEAPPADGSKKSE